MSQRVSDERLKSLENLQRDAHGIQGFSDEAHRDLVRDGWDRTTAALLIAAANVGLDAMLDLRDSRAEAATVATEHDARIRREALEEAAYRVRHCAELVEAEPAILALILGKK